MGRRGASPRWTAGVLVLASALAACGGSSAETSPSTSLAPPSASVPAVQVGVDGTLERDGEALVGRATVTNQGPDRVWVPVGPEAATRPRLLPAAAGGGVVDIGWVIPPTLSDVEGVVSTFVFRPVEPGATLSLEATDDPPPPDALVDTSGEPVEVMSYRLCVDAFADAALPPTDRTTVPGTADVVVDAGRIDGESERTCGPSVPA